MASLVVNGRTTIILLEIKVVLFDYVQHKYFCQSGSTSNLFLTWVSCQQPSPLPCANPKLIKMNGEWKGILILKLLWMTRNRSWILNGFLWLSVKMNLVVLSSHMGQMVQPQISWKAWGSMFDHTCGTLREFLRASLSISSSHLNTS